MRIFLDTTVLISAFTARGICGELFRVLLNHHLTGEHELLLGEPVLREFTRVMLGKFRVPREDLDIALATLNELRFTGEAAVTPDMPPIADADDVPIVASAVAAAADLLVTGDKLVLELGRIANLRIVSPREMWFMLHPLIEIH